ncbi:hypothetical protein NDA13_005148 [Ustilago tritici]|nr:hypothetical protein NDA13_005148 [Ustilago tritici]
MVEAVPRATCAGGNTNVVVAPAATVSRTAPDPIQVATPRCPTGLDGLVSLTPLSPAAPDLEPAQRPPPPQGSAQHIDGPAGPPNLSTPLLQGLARLVSDSASMLDLGTPPLQGSARSIVMPAGLGGTRTPSLQGLAQLFDLVLAALDVPSADRYLSLLLNAWSHNPGPCPNTSFAGNVFDPALQPARHGSMQECAFAWSTLLSLYSDPIYRCQLLGMTKHGCLLGYDRPLHPVFRPQASNCWSDSPTSPVLVALSTQPSTGSVPSNPTTWILASTPQVLLAVGKMANLFPQDHLVLQAAFTCFLHSGELVWDCGTNRTTILTVSSIEWASDHVVLTLPASKTDPFRQGVRVVAPEVGGIECLVARLRHLSHGRPLLALLFGLGPSGLDPLPWSTFVTILHRAIQACGLPALQYTGHSFCHGAATWASQHGASTADIQSLGRWSSNCYCHYIDRSAQEHCALVASALFSVRDGPLVPSGPAWRDPGLA